MFWFPFPFASAVLVLVQYVTEVDHANGASCTGAQQSDCKWKLGQTLREWFSHVFLYSEIQLDGVWFDLPDTIWSFFSCRGLVKLQQPCKQARVRMLSMEPFGRKYKVDDRLFCQPTFQPKTKHLAPMNVLLLVAWAFEWWTHECSAAVGSLLLLSGFETIVLVTHFLPKG